jgi:formate hydrogenlyase transcriptional activator
MTNTVSPDGSDSKAIYEQLRQCENELAELREQQAATREILHIISRSPTDVHPVFETIANAALRLCRLSVVNMVTYDGQLLHVGALAVRDPVNLKEAQALFPCEPSPATAAGRAVLAKRIVAIPDVLDDPLYGFHAGTRIGVRSVLGVPLLHAGVPIGALAICRPEPGRFPESQVALLRTFADQAVIAIQNTRTHIELRQEIEAHRKSKATIRLLVEQDDSGPMLHGASKALAGVRKMIDQVAVTDSTVLIQGETGTGKELVARAIHGASSRRDHALIKLNCAALPRELIESELFGHEKGAFSGATQQRRGRFELADGGTLFLDEVGELPLDAQAKLLRVLQEGEFERIGGSRTQRVDVRVIAATNRTLKTEVEAGRFRSDLYYRLNVFPIVVPPLRERRDDIPILVQHFIAYVSRKLRRPTVAATPEFLERACAYHWPGNVRELANLIERALILSDGQTLVDAPGLFPARTTVEDIARRKTAEQSIETVERTHMRAVLERARWRVEGDGGAAQVLGLKPSTLRARMRKLGIERPAD